MTTSNITIIGGGIIGLLTAREFSNAGATVTVIEKNTVGQESSWAGGGILLPLYPWRQAQAITDLVLHSLRLYPNLAAQLFADTGIDPEWTPCGLLITQNPDVAQAIAWCEASNMAYQRAGVEFFRDLNAQTQQPLWLPDIAQARNPRLLQAVKQDLLNKGVCLREQCALQSVILDKNRITAINTTTGRLAVEQLIITTGAWTGQLFQQLFSEFKYAPKVVPVKGQMLLFEARPDTLRHIVLEADQYLIPRRDGKILVGSTVEHADFDKTTTDEAKDKLTTFARHLLPALKNYPLIKHWAGLRPGTIDGVPIIAKHPEIANLSINAGHFRNGLAMGPASAQLLVDIVLKRSTTVEANLFALDKFGTLGD